MKTSLTIHNIVTERKPIYESDFPLFLGLLHKILLMTLLWVVSHKGTNKYNKFTHIYITRKRKNRAVI